MRWSRARSGWALINVTAVSPHRVVGAAAAGPVDAELGDAMGMSGVDRERLRRTAAHAVEGVVSAWRDGVAMLDE